MNTVKIQIIDRLDRSYEFEAYHNQPFKQFLLINYIPSSSIILRVNGFITDDQTYIINRDDEINVDMIRAYQLPEYCQMLDLWGQKTNDAKTSSIYTNKILWFNESGICNLKQSHISKEKYCDWIENKFVESIHLGELINVNDEIFLPLSGGRDSLALLYLLERTRDRLPKFSLQGVTVAPTVASVGDLDIASEAIKNLGVKDYFILDFEYVKTTLNLKNDFCSVMDKALLNQGRGVTISLWHGIMKACIERFCRERKINKIAYGYQFEDLIASLLRSNILGIPFGETMQQKKFGEFKLVFPLWAITKKELTIYLNLVAPNHQTKQSNPNQYDRGDHNRDIHYFLADTLSTIYPGIGFSLFTGYKEFNQNYVSQEVLTHCANCNSIYSNAENLTKDNFCSTCDYFAKINELELANV